MELPTKAGQAVLEYSICAQEPTRKGDVITIPALRVGDSKCECGHTLEPKWMYCPHCGDERRGFETELIGKLIPLLEDYEQFVYTQPDLERNRFTATWFGGTDEAPFLVRMDSWTYEAAQRGGRDFYSYIIPTKMLTLCRKWGGEWKRQGDIFAYKLPFSWNDLKEIGNFNKTNGLQIHEVAEDSVFGTRHILCGQYCSMMLAGGSMTIAEGTIVAPDHTDMGLKGPHALDQTAHLYDPPNAD